jgi:hypothetical protein
MIKLTLSSKVQTFKGSSPKNAEQNVNVMTKRRLFSGFLRRSEINQTFHNFDKIRQTPNPNIGKTLFKPMMARNSFKLMIDEKIKDIFNMKLHIPCNSFYEMCRSMVYG